MPGLPSLGGLLRDPLSNLLSAASDIIGRFVASPEQKLQAQLELSKLSSDFTLKLAELDAQNAATQAAVIQTEAKSESWMARNWRPMLMLSFTYIIVHTYVFVPLFGLRSVAIPPDMWGLLKLGVGGYVIGRSVEKSAPAVAAVVRGGGAQGEK